MIDAAFLTHAATIAPYSGSGAYGDIYGPPFTVPCYYEGRRQLVRDGNGSETVTEGVMFVNAGDLPDTLGGVMPAGSRVQVADRTTWAVTVATFDDGSDHGLAYLEVALA